ncbi:DUF4097 family beta strand repeat-containing protein [Tengunoibacter tsumagoiensis]|uniref:DUF4097 domain-containing protein n=1 Tax=Tengunoibacter tsumagoiensis TaxID=2014871 RepID=A0A402A5E9_9CHLR|nr:DUF4097 family beta strand repeat-containing protein [Tengunoibacter tsumagoiensis]GCE14368.1 hypothetical protein KTT_42270 [Tengunoibacter tsumagoiensis]
MNQQEPVHPEASTSSSEELRTGSPQIAEPTEPTSSHPDEGHPLNAEQTKAEEEQPPAASQAQAAIVDRPPVVQRILPLALARQRFEQRRMQYTLGRLLIILFPIALVLAGIVMVAFSNSDAIEVMNTRVQTFHVTRHPKLIINDDTGAIHVSTSALDGTIAIKATEYVSGSGIRFGAMDLSTSQRQNTITINAGRTNIAFFASRRVDLEVVLPASSDLIVIDRTGSLEVGGVHGQIQLQTSSGSILVNNSMGNLQMQTETGSLAVKGFRGTSTIVSQHGEMYLNQTSLYAPSSLEANDGSVTFNGQLDPHGTYHFTANNGSVDLTLPKSTLFHVAVNGGSGPISNEFEAPDKKDNVPISLIVGSQNGAINIRKAP